MFWYTPLAIALVRSKLPEGKLAISYEYFENTLSKMPYPRLSDRASLRLDQQYYSLAPLA